MTKLSAQKDKEMFSNHVSVYLTDEQWERLNRAAGIRRVKPSQMSRYLLEHGLDWWEGLSQEQQVVA